MQLVEQFLNDGHRVLTGNDDGIQLPVVDAKPPSTVFLLNQDDRLRERTVATLNDS